jgi:hypothetical protein
MKSKELTIMKKKAISIHVVKCIAVTACVACCGCDVEIPSMRKATEQVAKYTVEQAPKDSVEPVAAQIANERASLEHFAESRLKMIEVSEIQTEKALREIRFDRDSMSKRVNEISGMVFADKNAGAGDVLLALLKDPALNSLASKHLGNDFALQNTEFVSKMRNAVAKEKERDQELADNRLNYRALLSSADGKAAAAAKRTANDIAKMQKEIAEKEKRLKQLRSSLMGSRDAKLKSEREIRSLESEILRARNRLYLIRREADRTSSGASISQAQMRFDNVNKDIERRYKHIMTAQQVADEYERNTVRKLDAAMCAKESELESKMAIFESQKVFISSVSVGIDKLGLTDLKEIRSESEKVLAKKPKAAVKGK